MTEDLYRQCVLIHLMVITIKHYFSKDGEEIFVEDLNVNTVTINKISNQNLKGLRIHLWLS